MSLICFYLVVFGYQKDRYDHSMTIRKLFLTIITFLLFLYLPLGMADDKKLDLSTIIKEDNPLSCSLIRYNAEALFCKVWRY